MSDYNDVMPSGRISSVDVFLRAASGRALQTIQHFAFMPAASGYYCVYRKSDGKDQAVWSGISTSLRNHLDTVTDQHLRRNTHANGAPMPVPFMKCSVGHSESWVVIEDNGNLDFSGISANLAKKLRQTSRGRVKVGSAALRV